MKKNLLQAFPSIAAAFGVAALLCHLAGCATGPSTTNITTTTGTNGVVTTVTNTVPGVTTVDTNAVLQGIRLGATVATQEAVQADSNSVPYFVLAEQVISVAVLNNEVNPTNITSSILALTVNGKPNQQAAIGINAAIQAYQIFFSQQVANNLAAASPLAIQALDALIAGINDGLPPQPIVVNPPPAPTLPAGTNQP